MIDTMVEIFEQDLIQDASKIGKIAILRGGFNTNNPIEIMNEAVSTYVGDELYSEFTEISCGNPWVRIIISGINELDYMNWNSYCRNLQIDKII